MNILLYGCTDIHLGAIDGHEATKHYGFEKKQIEKKLKIPESIKFLFFSISLLTTKAKTQKSGNNDFRCLYYQRSNTF